MKIFIILGILAGLLIIGPKILRESEYFSNKTSLKSKKKLYQWGYRKCRPKSSRLDCYKFVRRNK